MFRKALKKLSQVFLKALLKNLWIKCLNNTHRNYKSIADGFQTGITEWQKKSKVISTEILSIDYDYSEEMQKDLKNADETPKEILKGFTGEKNLSKELHGKHIRISQS